MSLKPSSRFTAKGTKKVQAQRKDGSTENDEHPGSLRARSVNIFY